MSTLIAAPTMSRERGFRFIESLEKRCPVRPFVERADQPALTSAFHACVEELEKFRSLHLEYATRYIFHQAQTDPKNPHSVGTGGTPFMEYLKKHRDETAHSLLPCAAGSGKGDAFHGGDGGPL